jgi:hypothetical protein
MDSAHFALPARTSPSGTFFTRGYPEFRLIRSNIRSHPQSDSNSMDASGSQEQSDFPTRKEALNGAGSV